MHDDHVVDVDDGSGDLPVLYEELPGHIYNDPVRFERELDLVFGSRWLPAARVEEIPETGALARAIAGREVLLTREDEQTRAFYNVCAHRGSALVDEESSERFLKCGFHGWTYALDGRLVAAPGEKRFARTLRGECGLEGVATDEWGGWVWIRFGGGGEDLEASLSSWADEIGRYRPETQRIWGRRADIVPLNWKATVDAFNETYHVNFIHRGSVGRLVDGAATTFRFDGPHSRMVLPVRQTLSEAQGRSRRPPSMPRTDKDLLAEQARDHCNYTIFPNMILNCLPTWAIAIVFDPIAVDQTKLRTVMLADEPISDQQRDAFDRQWEEFCKVLDEDLLSIGMIARGVHSRGFRGVRLGGEEERVVHFQRTVEDHLTTDVRGSDQ